MDIGFGNTVSHHIDQQLGYTGGVFYPNRFRVPESSGIR